MIVLNLTPTKFSYGKIEFVETLLSRGADQRVANIHQQLPIHLACYGGQFSLLNVFLATSTGRETLEARDKDGNFCLHLAATVEGNTRMLKRLAALSNINNSNHNGETCLIIAAKMSHLRNLKTIIGQGANVRLTDSRGTTALHAAAAKGHTRIVEYLMAEAPGISNEVTSAGETALVLALMKKHEVAATTIIVHGADCFVEDKCGPSAKDYALLSNLQAAIVLRQGVHCGDVWKGRAITRYRLENRRPASAQPAEEENSMEEEYECYGPPADLRDREPTL